MMYFISLLVFLSFTKITNGKSLVYYSNFKFEPLIFGPEDVIVDYIKLADDQKENLPDSYTICSSIFVKFATTDIAILQMLTQDGTPWYRLALFSSRDLDKMSETLVLWTVNPITGVFEVQYLTSSPIPIVPNSWYHICMGLDTVSGLLRIVINGVVIVNEETDNFRNSGHLKPKSFDGKLLLFKGYIKGFWYQHRGITSNLNIFSSILSVENMVTRTSGSDDCSSPGDYIRLL